jgi:hypothetical protein
MKKTVQDVGSRLFQSKQAGLPKCNSRSPLASTFWLRDKTDKTCGSPHGECCMVCRLEMKMLASWLPRKNSFSPCRKRQVAINIAD